MTILKWSDSFYLQPRLSTGPLTARTPQQGLYDDLWIGNRKIDVAEPVAFDDEQDTITISHLFDHMLALDHLTGATCHPQLAYYRFAITHKPRYMETYFPLVQVLNPQERRQFHETIQKIMLHEGFDVQLRDRHNRNVVKQMPALGYLVAGHIVEVFFYRQDILDRLLRTGIHIWLYADQTVFKDDGGVAGGCYNLKYGGIQLVVNRLFEGFNQPAPGVIPFLHEFGHLLDYFDAAHLRQSAKSFGWMPGMRQSDDRFPPDGPDIFTPEARSAFVAGKRIEMRRYDRMVEGGAPDNPLPLGHPYVFQNNGEFLAGYLEMFFRNPHTFAAQNPDLYAAFSLLLRQDPRHYWASDFPFYVEQNRAFYRSGQRPPPHGLSLENDS